ncbi:MAG: hypothetical protein R8G66_01400 [Cytophagales bacterium]|nr:hypothetical protein [Cytophagales bacterium]
MAGGKLSQDQKNTWLGDIFDDLTHLEINTILKDSITAEISPEFEDLVTRLLDRYKVRLHKIINKHSLDPDLKYQDPTSFRQLDVNLDLTIELISSDQEYHIDEHDYSILLRINRFLNYLKQSEVEVQPLKKGDKAKELYKMNFAEHRTTDYDFRNINPRVKAKFRRMYDMNAEKVMMQTRFGIDGDVTSRISTAFTKMDQQEMLLKIHEQHTSLSLSYWKELVSTVTTLVGQVFKYFKPG